MRTKAPGYVIGGAIAAAGTGMIVHWQTRTCGNMDPADALGCSIGNDMGTVLGALVLATGAGILGLVATHDDHQGAATSTP